MPADHRPIPLRTVETPPRTRELYDDFLTSLESRISAGCDRSLVCREALRWLHGDEDGAAALKALTPDSTGEPWGSGLLQASFDPRNVTLEAERYGDADPERYAAVKPLIWLWYGFDRSPHGMNVEFGFAVRRLLARFIFRRCGANLKVFPYCELAFGYNMEVGDDVVIHRWVNLDDRAGIEIGDRSSLSDFVNVYSHSHDINEQILISNQRTVIEADCRITYHATILAGSRVRRGTMIGAGALLTSKTTRPGEVWLGVPAKPARDKDWFVDVPSGERWTVEELRRRCDEA